MFISQAPAPKELHGMEHTVFLKINAQLDFMPLLQIALLYLKDVFPLQFGQITDVKLEVDAHMEVTLEAETVCLTFHVNRVKYGIMIWSIVFVLRVLNGMVIGVCHVMVVRFGNHLMDANAQQDITSLEQDVKDLILLDAHLSPMLSGMANNVSVMKDSVFRV